MTRRCHVYIILQSVKCSMKFNQNFTLNQNFDKESFDVSFYTIQRQRETWCIVTRCEIQSFGLYLIIV